MQHELQRQQVTEFRIWDGIRDPECTKRGICKAHKQIVAWARSCRLPEVLIAEDDVWFSAGGALDYFLQQQPADFDLFLGGIIWGHIKSDNTVEDFSGSMLYLAKERFYNTILDLPEDKDYDRSMAGLGKFVVCHPMVACQQAGYSDHHGREVDFQPMIRQLKWFTG